MCSSNPDARCQWLAPRRVLMATPLHDVIIVGSGAAG